MHYTVLTRTVSILCVTAFLGAPALYFCYHGWRNDTDGRALLFMTVLFGLPSAYLLMAANRVRIVVSPEGIFKRCILGGVTFVAWDEIAKVTSSYSLAMFFVRTSVKGKWFSMNHNMEGIELAILEMKRRLPFEVYGCELERPLNNKLHIG